MNDFLKFFDEKTQDFPMHLEITYSKICDWGIYIYKRGCANDYPKCMLTTYPEINCFVTQSDEQAAGIINAIKAKGASTDDYIIVSIDCSTTGQSYLKSGELDATVLMAMRQLAVSSADYVESAIEGKEVDKKNQVEGYYQIVTPDTYEEVMLANGMTPAE